MRYALCLFLSLWAATAYAATPMPAADPPTPAPVVPPFVLPVTPTPAPVPPPVGVPIPLTPGKPFAIRINAATVLASPEGLVRMKTKAEPVTVVDADGVDVDYSGDKSVCFVWPVKGASGPCELLIVPTDGSAVGRVQLIVGGGPAPVPPTPPKPPTPPLPPDPFSSGMTAADAASLRVLIVYDDTALAKATAGQKAAIYGAATRAYLNSHTSVGTDGKTHEWRIWDVTMDGSNDEPVFAKAFKRPHASVPWIIVGNGVTGYEGPLPDHIEDTTALLNKFGGSN